MPVNSDGLVQSGTRHLFLDSNTTALTIGPDRLPDSIWCSEVVVLLRTITTTTTDTTPSKQKKTFKKINSNVNNSG
ncbi:unnamed protein product [Allacma fusca]|uniref:Uncharacterized protein n=1 Tax=Allacma fusca TaxID=39272 RepID=A0A8J2KM96_9HEXA|nr:unnamed protein product [Allacma fusca]